MMTQKIGIFFGTDSGSTRLIAKKIYKIIGPQLADKPLNINRANLDDLMNYNALILGTPTYGQGQLPGRSTGMQSDSWEEILPLVQKYDFKEKTIALYGLGDQEKYGATFVNALGHISAALSRCGGNIVGHWSTDGYNFSASDAVSNNKFPGLVIDQPNQGLLTESRIEQWLAMVLPQLTDDRIRAPAT